jgi:phosphate transport system ATP-binding protein
MKPEILLLDEPTSALDPIATASIEELLFELSKDVTMILVTHNISQAARISDYSIFLYLGDLIEYGKTKAVFTRPSNKKTEEYLSGKFG